MTKKPQLLASNNNGWMNLGFRGRARVKSSSDSRNGRGGGGGGERERRGEEREGQKSNVSFLYLPMKLTASWDL